MNKKNTKNALFMSVISLLLCFSMLIGTTFAWFTDSVTSGSNVITSGNLDLEVQYTLDGENWNDLNGATDLFRKGLWEPGHTEVVALKVANVGSLALKYVANMKIFEETVGKTKDGTDIVLSDILTVSTLTQQTGAVGDFALMLAYMGENMVAYEKTATFKSTNVLGEEKQLLPGDSHYVFIKVDMAETVGNEANHDGTNIPTIDFGLNVLATQFTYENDSFGNEYDKNATYDDLADTSILATETKTLEEGAASVGFNLVHNGMTIAKVTVPASAIADATQPVTVSFDGMNPADTIELGANTKAYAFDIKVSNLKEELADDQLVTVVVTAPYALPMMKAYHNGEEIAATYDELAGTITFKTANFSPFTFSYEEMTVSTLDELRKAVEKSDILIKLGADLTVDLGTDEGAVYTAQNTGGDGYYYTKAYKNGVIVSGQNVAVDLNGHTITVTCDTAKLDDAGALFFVDPEVEGSSLNIIDQSEAQTGTIVMKASAYMVWANEDADGEDDAIDKTTSYDVDIFSGKFVSDKYAGDPVAPDMPGYAENSNCAIVYAGNGGTINVYGGYFLYDNTYNSKVQNSNNGAFNVITHVTTPCITLHDGVMLSNQYYRQANGTDDDSINLAGYCEIVETNDISVTINGKAYSKWYRVTSTQPVSLTVEGQEVYARNDTPEFTVKVNYTYGSSKIVTNYTMSEVDMSTAGIKTATISYTENGKTVNTEITFKVNAVASIVAVPKQEVYNKGVQLKTTDFAVRAVTNEGMSTNITNFTISNVDTSTTGEKTVTITYNDNGTEFANTCKITVKNINKVSANSVSLHGWNAGQFIAGSNWVDSYYGYNGKTYTGENGEKATGFNVSGHVGSIKLGNPETGYGSLTVTNAKPYTKIGHWGWISFDNYAAIEMGYYFDGDVTTYVQGTAIYTGITTDNPDYAVYGPNCHNYQLQADLTSFAPGSNHTVTFVVATEDGILDLCTWKISMANETEDVFIDTDKHNVNVIILAGQSNACGPAPITSAIRNQYENHDFSNVFIHYRNTGWDGSKYAIVTENVGFDKYQLGIGGWQSYYFGPELGLAYTLSTQATDEQWYIIKYAPTGTCLATEWLSGANLADDMIAYVKDAIDMLDDEYDVRVRSFLWMQGESDATAPGTANAYANNEQALVSKVRTELAAYATRSSLAPSVAGSGIAYVNAGIAPNGRADGTNATTGKYVAEGGPNDWIYATYVNLAKYSNCQLWYLPTVTVEGSVFTPGIPVGLYDNNPGHTIKNSIYIDTAALSSKAVATGEHSEYTIESDKSDWAHYNANSMNKLGHWFGASTLYMLNNG